MERQVVIVTGAAGFLGSAITVDLSRDHRVVALDCRCPTGTLLRPAPNVTWRQVDIACANAVASVLGEIRSLFTRIDFVVHFAAFYHFDVNWHPEYERTNLRGTSNILQSAANNGTKRILFASSVAAMLPPPPGETLTERTTTADYIPYARSKTIGERMLRDASARLPGVALRIGGAFSDWSELPMLSSLIALWAGRSPLSRLMPGRGTSGVPYIHRDDVVRIVRCCIERHEAIGSYDVFMASQQGAVLHRELFAAIRQGDPGKANSTPIHISPGIARLGTRLRRAIGFFSNSPAYERPWMLDYLDQPWVVDATYTRNTLGWSCTEGMGVLDRIPKILANFRQERRTWIRRNEARNGGCYAYCG
jgi:nucleoside-diphosphate-sugar epimerase